MEACHLALNDFYALYAQPSVTYSQRTCLSAECCGVGAQLHRTTFHDFMLDVHARLHTHERTADPLTLVAAQLVSEFKVLCLDEFFVTDVADASMLNRLFSQMWDRGLVFVATSNRCSPSLCPDSEHPWLAELDSNVLMSTWASLREPGLSPPALLALLEIGASAGRLEQECCSSLQEVIFSQLSERPESRMRDLLSHAGRRRACTRRACSGTYSCPSSSG